jgi:hypothetical protein
MTKFDELKRVLFASVPYLCLVLLSCHSQSALEVRVKEMLEFDKFNKSMLDERAMILVASETDRRFFTRDDLDAYVTHAKESHEIYKASDFKVIQMHEDEHSPFALIAYEFNWNVTLDGTTRTTHIVSDDIWERGVDGWHRLSAAMTSTGTNPEKTGVSRVISASSDQTGQHPGLAAIVGPATVSCLNASSDIQNPQPPPSCNILAPGYTGSVTVGQSVGASAAGTVTLTCNGQRNKLSCSARVQ